MGNHPDDQTGNSQPSKRQRALFWSAQIVLPLSVLGLLKNSGIGLQFSLGLVLLLMLFSLLSIFAKLFKFKKNRYRFTRPLLTLAVGIIMISIANGSYSSASDAAYALAIKINTQCQQSKCPDDLTAWNLVQRGKNKRPEIGNYYTYPVFYKSDGNTFHLHIAIGMDRGEKFTGGVGLEVTRERIIG